MGKETNALEFIDEYHFKQEVEMMDDYDIDIIVRTLDSLKKICVDVIRERNADEKDEI